MIHAQNSKEVVLLSPATNATNADATNYFDRKGFNYAEVEVAVPPATATNSSAKLQVLALSGAMAGLAAVLGLAFYGAGDPTLGQGYELTAIAACIIGGTPLAGGRGSVVGALAGSLILSVVASSLVFFQVPINWTTFATGGVILLAVAADSALRRRRTRRRTGQ